MPIDPILASLLISGGSAAVGSIFGDDDEFQMSPERRRIFNVLSGELGRGEFGFSADEKAKMINQLRGELKEGAERQTRRSTESLKRRDLLSPGQAGGAAVEIESAFGKQLGEGVTDINLASAREARRRKGELERTLLGASQAQFQPADDIFGDIGGLSENIMSILLKRGDGDDDFELPRLRQPRRPQFSPGPLRQ